MKLESIEFADFDTSKIPAMGKKLDTIFQYNSDIDIAVEGIINKDDEFKILNEFDLLQIPYTVDVVFVNNINKKELINSINKEGVEF